MRKAVRFAARLFAAFLPALSLAQNAPTGWSKSSDEKAGTITFKPADLKPGELFLVREYAREMLEGKPLDEWLGAQLRARGAPEGRWIGEGSVQKGTANVASGSRTFRDGAGREGALLLTGICLDGQSARMVALVFNSEPLMKRHTQTVTTLIGQIMALEKEAAVAEDRGLTLEPAPPKVKGITAGGPLKAGRYKGNMVTTWDNTVLRPVDVLIFENGEFEFLEGQQWRDATGTYQYSPSTGRFQAQDPLSNDTYDPDEDFCIAGKEASGTAVIYAEEDMGTSIHRTRLRWIAAVDRDPPSVVKQRKAQAEEEAEQYKFVTAPGKGLQPADLEAILCTQDLRSTGTGSTLNFAAYILMKDGRVRDGLPVPAQDLDVAMSRSREPDSWGYWRRKEGFYEFAWPVRPNDFSAPAGTQSAGQPVPTGTKLTGNFKGASSWGMIGGTGGANFWGVRFGPKGRFEKWKHGISGSGTSMVEGQVSVGAAYDDEGSATVISGNGVGGGTISKNNNPDAHRMGWYEFDGFALTLRFDNGKIVRMPTFTNDEKTSLWFEGYLLSLEEPEKK